MKAKNNKSQPTEFQQKIRKSFTLSRIVELLDAGLKAETSKYFQGQCAGTEPAYMVRLAYLKAAVELAGLAVLPQENTTPEDDPRLQNALGNLKSQVV